MVSGAVGLKTPVAIAVLAMLFMSSQGHPRTKPLCSDCQPQCNTNCTAIAAVGQACCQKFCGGSDGTSSFSCCPNGTSSVTCSCDSCKSDIQNSCTSPCSDLRCMACRDGFGKQCNQSCLDDCNNNCVKKNC
ncbi:hypothetical protein HU200_034465 [Digitaria exilis]|uniref:Uncharacterized protein n=1 Tax=Digitaria exilis TaxID=1010633 RepID=A0A835BTK5_9POAL|nr:hypothetical protein HU200_034465 [Digitaria exilis]